MSQSSSVDTGVNVRARPPGYVFAIVWPILYILLGYAWETLSRGGGILTDLLFGLYTFGLALWLVLYNCYDDKRSALYLIFALLGGAIALQSYGMRSSLKTQLGVFPVGLLLTPIVIWLSIATALSWESYHQDQ